MADSFEALVDQLNTRHLTQFSPASRELLAETFLKHESAFMIPRGVTEQIVAFNSCKIEDLMRALLPFAQTFSVSPISQFEVGVVGLGKSGNLYLGSNWELPSQHLGYSVHAEQACVSNALLAGESTLESLSLTAAPCGHCRQFLYELDGIGNLTCHNGSETNTLASLLPNAFSPKDLQVEKNLLEPNNQKWEIPGASGDKLLASSVSALAKSHAPYSGCPSAICLQTEDGHLFTGTYIESVAFNPSLPPLQAALCQRALSTSRNSRIVDAVLVEIQGASVRQKDATHSILSSLAPACGLRVFELEPLRNND
ncbi:MAG: cytidine deaminase [Planctomycetota bacterium]